MTGMRTKAMIRAATVREWSGSMARDRSLTVAALNGSVVAGLNSETGCRLGSA